MNDADIQAIRDRLAHLEYQDREVWRELRRQDARRKKLEERVQAMTEADKIAASVTTALRDERRRRMTIPRKAAGLVAALILLVPAVHDGVTWLSASAHRTPASSHQR